MFRSVVLVFVVVLLVTLSHHVQLGESQPDVAEIAAAVLNALRPDLQDIKDELSCLKERVDQLNETVTALAEESNKAETKIENVQTSLESVNTRVLLTLLPYLNDIEEDIKTELGQMIQTSVQGVDTRVLLLLLPYLNVIEEDIKTELGQMIVDYSLNKEIKECLNQTALDLANLLYYLHYALDVKLDNLTEEIWCVKANLSSVKDCVNDLIEDLEEHSLQSSREIQSSHQTSLEKFTQICNKMDTLQSTVDSVDARITQELNSIDCASSSQLSLHDTRLTSLSAQMAGDMTYMMTEMQDHDNKTTTKLMKLWNTYTCGCSGGWRRAVYMDMSDPSTTCPSGWNQTDYLVRTCGRASHERFTCDSVFFPVSGGEYSQVCGRVRAYQWGLGGGFSGFRLSIDEQYFGGVAVMHGSPREHVWTFAVGATEGPSLDYSDVCPCDRTPPRPDLVPSFVKHDYFCESGYDWPGSYVASDANRLHSGDLLWDGEDCHSTSTCCSYNRPPYFTKTLSTPTTDDLELRMCCYYGSFQEDVAVEVIELYVK